ncbi:MAG: NHL repeat-containing protein [Myxococcaceae bacterium]
MATSAFPQLPSGVHVARGVFELKPHGQRFNEAVSVYLPGMEGETVLTADPDGAWKPVACATFGGGEHLASVRHFSYFGAATVGTPGGRIFFSDGSALRSMDLEAGDRLTLVPGAAPDQYITGVAIDSVARQVYWTDNATDQVTRIDFDGGARAALYTAGDRFLNPGGVAVDVPHGRLFWAEGGTVVSSDLDGHDVATLITATPGVNYASDVAVDPCAAQLYWADQGTDTINRSDSLGDQRLVLYTNPDPTSNPRGVAVDRIHGKLFWADGFDIRAANLDGSQPAVIVPGGFQVNYPTAIALSVGRELIYWTDNGTDTVSVPTYAGTDVRVLFQSSDRYSNPRGIAVDPGN